MKSVIGILAVIFLFFTGSCFKSASAEELCPASIKDRLKELSSATVCRGFKEKKGAVHRLEQGAGQLVQRCESLFQERKEYEEAIGTFKENGLEAADEQTQARAVVVAENKKLTEKKLYYGQRVAAVEKSIAEIERSVATMKISEQDKGAFANAKVDQPFLDCLSSFEKKLSATRSAFKSTCDASCSSAYDLARSSSIDKTGGWSRQK